MTSSSYYKLIVFSIFALLWASCGSKKSAVSHDTKLVQHDVVEYGKKYLNTPYRYAGKGPNSFDCSGYTSFVFKKFGYNLHSSSAGQARQGEAINSKKELEIGDLVFFEGNSRNGRVGHVGIVSDIHKNGRFSFIHASTSYGVIISSSEEPYYKARYLRGGRVIKDIQRKQQETNLEETTIADNNNNIKIQDNIVYKETDDGFVAINKATGKPLEGTVVVSAEQTSKPVKIKEKEKKEEEEKKKKQKSEIRQTAIRGSEETLVTPPNRITHKVKPGETLYSIAKKHNCSVEELKRWNPTIENNTIQAGERLYLYK